MAPHGGSSKAHPDTGAQDAGQRRDLETRVYGGGSVSRADVDELRRLLARPVGAGRGAGAEAVPRVPDPAPVVVVAPIAMPVARASHLSLHPRLWLAGGILAVVVAGTVSAAVAAGVTRAGVQAAAEPTATTEVIGSPPAVTSDGPVAEAEALGAQYFTLPQEASDRPSVAMHGIVASSTHRVLDQYGPGGRRTDVWVGQGVDGSFCLIMAVGQSRGASSCTPEADVIATGVRLDMLVPGGGTIDVTWNLASGLLAFSPYPSAVSAGVTQSKDIAGTP